MRPTLEYIIERFEYYNQLCFDGELILPPIRLNTRYAEMGVTKAIMVWDEKEKTYKIECSIEISVRRDLPEYEYTDTLVHEMIHYYLYYTGEDPRCRHGKAFKAMAKRFNREYGMNITPTIDTSMMKPSCNASKVSKFFFKIFN